MERESDDEYRLPPEAQPIDRDAEDAEHRRGLRHWMAENEQSFRVFLLITAYASLMLYLIALLVLGRPSLGTRIFKDILIGSLFVAFILFRLSGPVDKKGRTMWEIYRAPGKERVEQIVAAMLWGLIAIGVLALFLYTHAHPGK